ncbi:MAG: BCD family MFS transporter [Pseudomonadota bacterium]
MTSAPARPTLGWLGVIRLGLVQSALGAIIMICTSTLNRVMVVEIGLPAMLPGALVGLHYGVQMSRPHWGHGADVGGKRAPWIIGGMATLGLGATGAAAATAIMASAPWLGIALAMLAFAVIGVGVGAAGTNLLALLAARTAPSRKAAAAAIVWIMMIFGFVLTAGISSQFLDPFTYTRLVVVTAVVSAIAFSIAVLAVLGVEKGAAASQLSPAAKSSEGFKQTLAEIWSDTAARRFTIFVFVSMLAYSAQDLILEPFAGLIYGYTPGESTAMAGVQNGGVLLGMIATAIIGTTIGKSRASFMRAWTVGGCLASTLALFALAGAAWTGPAWPLDPLVFALGLANGAFAVAAIGSMMTLASAAGDQREGIRMGLWGASQAIAFAIGGFAGAAALDGVRALLGDPSIAFTTVFAVEGALFAVAAGLALWVGRTSADDMTLPALPAGDILPAE